MSTQKEGTLSVEYAQSNMLGMLYAAPPPPPPVYKEEEGGAREQQQHGRGLTEALSGLGTVSLKKTTQIRDASGPALWRAKEVYELRKQNPTDSAVISNYLLQLPEEYHTLPTKKWPLILYLHGSDHRGQDLEVIRGCGVPYWRDNHKEFPFIVLSPQCPIGNHNGWEGTFESLNGLLDKVVETHRVDEERIYVTGLSMGGYGTWAIALQYPQRFAGIAPVCGAGKPSLVTPVHKKIAVWSFHGENDAVVTSMEVTAICQAMENIGANVKSTILPGHDHCTIIPYVYENPPLYQWFQTISKK
eukprot:TRINITY_DN4756_c0_g1_i1.p1 TRINITY_DN4756_c0_g1~~TRINITY_DN4756_c0_g1_i1.p1  ORF type:complete len:302 (+),score=60.53 TRINITY_DN4756_c0_g1_i1:2-907(+)